MRNLAYLVRLGPNCITGELKRPGIRRLLPQKGPKSKSLKSALFEPENVRVQKVPGDTPRNDRRHATEWPETRHGMAGDTPRNGKLKAASEPVQYECRLGVERRTRAKPKCHRHVWPNVLVLAALGVPNLRSARRVERPVAHEAGKHNKAPTQQRQRTSTTSSCSCVYSACACVNLFFCVCLFLRVCFLLFLRLCMCVQNNAKERATRNGR